jgi:hypothetical protein
MITREKLLDSILEAERFLSRAQDLREKLLNDEIRQASIPLDKYRWAETFPKESGAVRRASLDLTRSLAELRKS